jgi:hypothetical protein
MRTLIATLMLTMSVGGAAWAQSEEEVTAAAKEELHAYAACLFNSAVKQAKGSALAAEKIVDQAPADCIPERKALSARLRKPPIGYSPNKAEDEIDAALLQIRPQLLDTVKKERTP